MPRRYAAALVGGDLSRSRRAAPAFQFVIPVPATRVAALRDAGVAGAMGLTTEAEIKERHPGAVVIRVSDSLGRIASMMCHGA